MLTILFQTEKYNEEELSDSFHETSGRNDAESSVSHVINISFRFDIDCNFTKRHFIKYTIFSFKVNGNANLNSSP